jgi:DNA-binding NarL/FixJ family response regulator
MKRWILYGIILGVSIAVLKVIEYRFLIYDHAVEIYGGIVALIFTIVGIWIGSKIIRAKSNTIQTSSQFILSEKNLEKLGISPREMEVLELIASGLSNQEIADKLFVSINTVKTHSSNLFIKLDVRRRTEAIQKARTLQLIP